MEKKPSLWTKYKDENGNIRIRIDPHPGQQAILQNDKRFQVMLAGSGGGKTTTLPLWLWQEIRRCGDGDYLAVSPTFPLQNLRLIPVFIDFFQDTLNIGKFKTVRGSSIMEVREHTDDGDIKATIFFGSAKNAESLESAVANAACLDEAGQDKFKISAWEAVLRRVGHKMGRILITTTLYNYGWLKRELYDRWQAGDQDINVVQFDSINNPHYSKLEYARAKASLPTWKFNMQYRGIYARPAGQIYNDFDENIHVVDPFPIPNIWNWHVGIDPGSVHAAFVWIAESPDHKYYIVHSYLRGNKTTKELVAETMQRYEYGKVIDWRGGAGNEQQFRDDWKDNGIPVQEPSIRNVAAMIDRVTALLKERKLFIFNNDENTNNNEYTKERSIVEEFRSFSRELDDLGQPTEKIHDESSYHKLAALRYFASKIGTVGDYSSPVYWQNNIVPNSSGIPKEFLLRGVVPKF